MHCMMYHSGHELCAPQSGHLGVNGPCPSKIKLFVAGVVKSQNYHCVSTAIRSFIRESPPKFCGGDRTK